MSGGGSSSSTYARRVAALGQRRGPRSRSGASDGDEQAVVLDPSDAGIEEAIQRLERKSFILAGLIPEIQSLLAVPAVEAKNAYIAALTQYSLVMMLILASLLGSALNPLSAENYPECPQGFVAAYNMLAMTICAASLFGTCVLVLESIIVEGTPTHRIHSIIAKSDALFHFGTNMLACGLHGTTPLILLRAWISGLEKTQCIILTAICGIIYCMMMVVYFRHLQRHWPVIAQRWTKMFAPFLYRQKASSAAIEDLVAELRYLQQPRDKTLTPAQLGSLLDQYLAALDQVLLADQSEFLHFLETEAGGRLAPMMEMLAKKTFEKAIDVAVEKMADEAIFKQQKYL
ncbi:unnamed protein product [Amoebophrya sp. A25]|nr:unnamed protein product [Amoebophrya sp. A25]|eukprot:GSA25T00020130001.1